MLIMKMLENEKLALVRFLRQRNQSLQMIGKGFMAMIMLHPLVSFSD